MSALPRPAAAWHGAGAPIAAVALAVVAVLLVEPAGVPAIARISWLASAGFAAVTLVAAVQLAGRLPAGAPARRFWWAVAGYGVTACAAFLWQAIDLGIPEMSGLPELHPISEVLLAVGSAGIVAVMATYPLGAGTHRERLRLWLDLATVLVAAGAFALYFLLAPGQDTGWWARSVVVGKSVIMLMAVFAVAKLLLAGRQPFSIQTGLIGAAAAAIGGLLGPLSQPLAGQPGFWFAASALGDGCMMIAAVLQLRQVRADPAASERNRRRTYSVLPYLAVAAVYALLVTVVTSGEHSPGQIWTVLVGAGAGIALMVVRQLTAFADNDRLLGRLREALAERDELTDRLRDLAFRDSLTGLANRALFHDRLGAALSSARRAGTPVAVMLVDLDDFKQVNDRHGHAAGDALLRAVGQRLRDCVRDADTVARLGGDEFGVILDNPGPGQLDLPARRIVTAVGEPYWHVGERLTVGASIGIAVTVAGQADEDQLLRDADAAMYTAKRNGKNSVATYPTLDDRSPPD